MPFFDAVCFDCVGRSLTERRDPELLKGDISRCPLLFEPVTALVFARQQDDAIGVPKGDAGLRKIREGYFLREDVGAIAILAGKSGPASLHLELPDLEGLRPDDRKADLCECDFVEQPIGSRVVGDVLCALCIGDAPVQRVPVPFFRAGKLLQLA